MNLRLIALATTIALGLFNYSSSGSGNPNSVSAFSRDRLNGEFRPPVSGETKAQVKAQYGDPDQVSHEGKHEERWVYVFGKDRLLGDKGLLALEPGHFVRVRVLRIDFDRDGRVTSWRTALVTTTRL